MDLPWIKELMQSWTRSDCAVRIQAVALRKTCVSKMTPAMSATRIRVGLIFSHALPVPKAATRLSTNARVR